MSELSSVGSLDLYEEKEMKERSPLEEKPTWKKISVAVLSTSLCIGLAAAISANLSKKRRVVPLSLPDLPTPALPIVLVDETKSPPPLSRIPYEQLSCTVEDRGTVRWIINTVANSNLLSLGFKANELKQKGDEIDHLHPYKFLASIFTDEKTRKSMQSIFDSSIPLKSSNVLGGIAKGMERERESLEAYLPSFAAEVGVPAEQLSPWIRLGDWKGLTLHLIRTNR
jgi:hypothetical protein